MDYTREQINRNRRDSMTSMFETLISKLELCICLPLGREKVINSQSHLIAHFKYCHYLIINGAELKNINKPRSKVIRVALNRMRQCP